MDMQTMLDNTIVAQRAKEMKTSEQLTLGETILKLDRFNDKFPVYFDDEKYRPRSLRSWRGSYRELAITYTEVAGSYNSNEVEQEYENFSSSYKQISTALPKNVTVKDLKTMLQKCIGKTFRGYKGGNFLMGKSTPLWVADYGRSSGFKESNEGKSQGVVDIKKQGNKIILITKLISC